MRTAVGRLWSPRILPLLNATRLDEVFWLVKNEGLSEIRRAKDDPQVKRYMEQGDQMGYLWKQGFFTGADPV